MVLSVLVRWDRPIAPAELWGGAPCKGWSLWADHYPKLYLHYIQQTFIPSPHVLTRLFPDQIAGQLPLQYEISSRDMTMMADVVAGACLVWYLFILTVCAIGFFQMY